MANENETRRNVSYDEGRRLSPPRVSGQVMGGNRNSNSVVTNDVIEMMIIPSSYVVIATSPGHSSMAEFMLEKLEKRNGSRTCKACDIHNVYSELEVCLAEEGRDWSRCQTELKAFKKCYDECINNVGK